MTRQIPPRPLTQRQRQYDEFEAFKDEVWRQDWLAKEWLESQSLWAQYHQEGGAIALLHDAEVAKEEARAVQAARNAKFTDRVSAAVAESWIDLDI